MPRQAYVNGRYLPHGDAAVHIEDRGYQFADGVYEVVPVFNGILVDEDLHLDRLDRSLSELRIKTPMSRPALRLVSRELMRRNGLTNGFLYMQVTRGVAARDHKFPKASTRPSLVMTTRQTKPHSEQILSEGLKVITVPDQRWDRCDIKSVSLLPNILGKQAAVEAGAYEAWQVDADGMVTEGTSTNAWIVTADNKVVPVLLGSAIAGGGVHRLLKLLRHETPGPDAVAERLGVESDKWHFLTGNKDSIYYLAQTSYFVTAMEAESEPDGFIHSGAFLLIDKRGRIRGKYDGTNESEVDQLLRDIETLKKEND